MERQREVQERRTEGGKMKRKKEKEEESKGEREERTARRRESKGEGRAEETGERGRKRGREERKEEEERKDRGGENENAQDLLLLEAVGRAAKGGRTLADITLGVKDGLGAELGSSLWVKELWWWNKETQKTQRQRNTKKKRRRKKNLNARKKKKERERKRNKKERTEHPLRWGGIWARLSRSQGRPPSGRSCQHAGSAGAAGGGSGRGANRDCAIGEREERRGWGRRGSESVA